MLCQIPGISNTIANVFVEKYKNMENFIQSTKQEFNDKKQWVTNIGNYKYAKNNRKMGEKVSEKIYDYLFSNNIECINNVIINSNEIIPIKKTIKKKVIKNNLLIESFFS